MTRIKICCISSLAEAELALGFDVQALGLVSAMPSGPGVIDEATIATVAGAIPTDVESFLLTSAVAADPIVAQHARCGTTTLQLVDAVERGTHAALRRALPGVRLVQVIHVNGADALDAAVDAATHVDAILLDSGNPGLATKELGGTGRTHDWSLSRQIRDAVAVPLYLAGGLHAGNVGAAIEQVQPFGVDVCSGVRTGDVLDGGKLEAFVGAVGAADLRRSEI
jgi:phosphoribosylanthranilate isomerase